MEPPVKLVEALFGPAAPFIPTVEWPAEASEEQRESVRLELEKSAALKSDESHTKWRFFGADMFELRLFVAPEFAIRKPPLQVDVYIGDGVDLESPLCRALGASVTAFTRNEGLEDVPLMRHFVRALERWSSGQQGFEDAYMSLPFGSAILIESIDVNPSAMSVQIVPLYEVESQWLSVGDLKTMWDLSDQQWTAPVDITELRFDSRFHSAITLVSVPDRFDDQLFVFKASSRDVRYMYHELKLLLLQEAHPNVISRPLLIVTKQCRFGAKKGVCGFLVDYHTAGTLKQILTPHCSLHGIHIDLQTRVKWALEIASALLHAAKSPAGYFSDLKLDNIVVQMRGDECSMVLIDFEQRGAWFSWSPPEINHVACLVYLTSMGTKFGIPEVVSQKYKALLEECLPSWSELSPASRYSDQSNGYNHAWISLSPTERERATVFMFGKVLWCLFEGQPTTNSATFFGAEIFREANPQHRFPDFRDTPERIQDLIRLCTAGAPELDGERAALVRVGNKVYPTDACRSSNETVAVREATFDVSKKWWASRLESAEAYIRDRHASPSTCRTLVEAIKRPSLEQVHTALSQYLCELQNET